MSEIFDQARAALKAAVDFYKSHGCPCAYPRFWQIVAFDFRPYGYTPVSMHLQQMLIGISAYGEGAVYKKVGSNGPQDNFVCPVCKTKISVVEEEFSISMRFMTMGYSDKLLARTRGAKPGKIPAPNGGGLFGLGEGSMEKIRRELIVDGTFEQLTAYLTAMDLTWPPKA
jgi:hypothetical protein